MHYGRHMRPLDELKAMACRAAAEHSAMSRACEVRWRDELEHRRRQLALAHAQLVSR
jgi:hypothetical protein